MADREREKKKKRAYLDDFEKDLNGNYQYRGRALPLCGRAPSQQGAGFAVAVFAAAGLR